MTEKEKALLGLEFKKGGKELKAQRDRAEALCFRLNHTPPEDTQKREEILRALIPDTGEGCYIKSPFICEYGSYITLGRNFFANYNCKLIDGGKITFGDDVLLGPDCTFVTPQHPVDPERRLAGYLTYKPITYSKSYEFLYGIHKAHIHHNHTNDNTSYYVYHCYDNTCNCISFYEHRCPIHSPVKVYFLL